MKRLRKFCANISENQIPELTSLCDKEFITPLAHQVQLLAMLCLQTWSEDINNTENWQLKPNLFAAPFPPVYCSISQPPLLPSFGELMFNL